jgi:hypothetical protein
MNKIRLILLLAVAFVTTSCDEESNVTAPADIEGGSNTYVFVAGEGSFSAPNTGTISVIDEHGTVQILDGVGNTVHAVEVYDDKLLVSINGDQKILIYDISTLGLEYNSEILMDGQSPRDIQVIDNKAYIATWNPDWYVYPTIAGLIKVLDLVTFEVEESIEVGIMPEGMIYSEGYLWVANSGESSVSKVDITSNSVISTYEVGSGPQFLSELNGDLYIARTFYDAEWNPAYGTSKISAGQVEQVNHVFAAGGACGGSVLTFNNKVYRSFDGGIAQIGDNLEIDGLNRIGDFNQSNVYHVEIIDGNILFAITDYGDLNQIHVLDQNGNEIMQYEVGLTPGDFTSWHSSE